jgi:hypothetical protein
MPGNMIGPVTDKTYDIVLSSGTPLEAEFTLLVDAVMSKGSSANPYVNVTRGLTASTGKNADNLATATNEYKKTYKLGEDGCLSFSLYGTNKAAASHSGEVTYTFNFSVAPLDTTSDPLPENIESIAITTPPKRTQYFDGGKFDRAGMVVTATLTAEEGSEPEAVEVNGYTVMPELLSLNDEYVTITFSDDEGEYVFEAVQPVTVLPSTNIGDVTIHNGQTFGNFDYDFSASIKVAPKQYPFLDILTLYGEATAEISFYVGDGIDVFIGNNKQEVEEDRLCRLSLPTSVDGTATTVTLRGEGTEADYTFTCYTQIYDGMPSRVTDYLCIASQYTNGFGLGPYGINPISTLRGGRTSTTSGSVFDSPTSLGNFGGYIVYEYDTPIMDDQNNPYGVDFIVYGNSYDGTNGFSEPGNVYVSADGVKYYALAGSLHYDDVAHWSHSISYTRNAAGKSEWTDSASHSSTGDSYPKKEYYPLFDWTPELENSITLTGTHLDAGGALDGYGSLMALFPDFGYADVGIRGTSNTASNPYTGPTGNVINRTDGFDLKWAVDEAGQPVTFPNGIQYVKIQTASNLNSGGGGIGEKSTEVHMMRTAAPADTPVGTTAKPSSITVNGNLVDLSGVKPEDKTVVINNVTVPKDGAFFVNVETEAANVYINSEHGAEATLMTPKHGILRIIVQDGTQEPWIAYLNLLTTGESGKYSKITFDPVGGTIEGADTRVYIPETTDKSFPVPAWNNRRFLGWFDAKGTKHDGYTEDMPRELTLTARWEYILQQGESPTVKVSFRLIGATKSKVMGEGENENDDIDLGPNNEYGYKGSEYVTWISTKDYTMNKGDTMYDLFTRALDRAGLAYEGAEKNYVSSITAPTYYGGEPLAEFTNGQRSGWMYTVGKTAAAADQKHPDRGLLQYDLQPGDVVIWHYVNDYAYEVKDWFEDEDYPSYATDAYNFYDEWLKAEDITPPNDGSVAPGIGQNGDEAESIADPTASLGGGGGGSIVATETVTAEAKTENGKATATVETAALTEAAAKAKEAVDASEMANAKAEVKIVAKTDGAAESVKSAEVDIPAVAIKAVADAKDIILTVESDVSTITLDTAALAAIAGTAAAGDTVKITAEVGDDSVVDLNITVGGTAITDLGGTATVSLPYTPDSELVTEDYDLLTVYHLADDGKTTEIKGAKYDAATKQITFATTHFSKFLISEWLNPFNDIAKGEWYYKAARYAYSNDLITGTGPTTFAPQSTLTRAMLITILARDAGIDTSGGETWYTKAADWGMETGLTDDTNMNSPVTREQFATLLYRYAQRSEIPTSGNADMSAYTDADAISEYARDAMAWAVAKGLITGRTATTLAPQGTATRAEAATLLQRYLANIG